MRRILVVSMLSSCVLVAAAATAHPTYHASAPDAQTRVTTGVAAPQITSRVTVVHIPNDPALDTYPNPARMLIQVNLDQAGTPTEFHVLQSISPKVDAHVVEAVRQFRWRPAMLDNQAIPLTVNLSVEVEH